MTAIGQYEWVMEKVALDPERMMAMRDLHDTYLRQWSQFSEAGKRAIYRLSEASYEIAGASDDSPIDIEAESRLIKARQAAIAEVALEREALNKAQPAKIRALLLPEEAELLPEWKFEKGVSIRPWARLADAETPETRTALRKHEAEMHRNVVEEMRRRREEAAATSQPEP